MIYEYIAPFGSSDRPIYEQGRNFKKIYNLKKKKRNKKNLCLPFNVSMYSSSSSIIKKRKEKNYKLFHKFVFLLAQTKQKTNEKSSKYLKNEDFPLFFIFIKKKKKKKEWRMKIDFFVREKAF